MPVIEQKTSYKEIEQDMEDSMVLALQSTRKEGGNFRDAARSCMEVAKPELDRLRTMNRNLGQELKAEKAKNAQGSL